MYVTCVMYSCEDLICDFQNLTLFNQNSKLKKIYRYTTTSNVCISVNYINIFIIVYFVIVIFFKNNFLLIINF